MPDLKVVCHELQWYCPQNDSKAQAAYFIPEDRVNCRGEGDGEDVGEGLGGMGEGDCEGKRAGV